MARAILLCLILVGSAYSYPNGAPKTACQSMNPGHGSESMFQTTNGDLRYDVASACYVIFPSDFMRVQVWDRTRTRGEEGLGRVQGLLMQVRRKNGDEISGVWSAASNPLVKSMTCTNANDALTHNSAAKKNDTQTQGVWTAPTTCQKNEEFEIRATIAQTKNRWHKVTVPLVCDPDYDNVEVMERVRPPLKSQYCAQGSWAIIPKKATEDFEKRLGPGSWRHFYGAVGYKFERKGGPTPVVSEGLKAQSGSYYFYYPTKGTSKNDMAGIYSPFGIQGCFCFSFYCYMDTDGKTEFTFSSIGQDQRSILRTKEVTAYWRRVLYSVRSEKPVLFAFQVFSSGSDDGGVGIDNVEVTPGPCDAATKGYAGFLDF